MAFTKEQRQEIVREFAIRHNGQYDPKLFLQEVRAKGPDHPAYEWFTWDDEKAAREHRLWQARHFASDLKVTFSVEEVGGNRSFSVKSVEVPLVHSPTDGRDDGGGYVLTDASNEAHMQELCRQGANALSAWLRRYKGAVEYAGGSTKQIERQLKALERVATPSDEAA
jgi:hypothetical protein